MKTIFYCLVLIAGTSLGSYAQEVHSIDVPPNETTEVSGDLSDGLPIHDLSWAWNSSVACFPATEQEHFTGHHVLYTFPLPSYSEVEIRVIPDDPGQDFSLYAYEVGQVSESNTVPNLTRCIRCEADFKWDRPKRGRTQDHSRVVTDILALRNPYEVVVGVVGANGLVSGGYTLQVISKAR